MMCLWLSVFKMASSRVYRSTSSTSPIRRLSIILTARASPVLRQRAFFTCQRGHACAQARGVRTALAQGSGGSRQERPAHLAKRALADGLEELKLAEHDLVL